MSADVVFKVRSNEQLLLLLKLVDVNEIETKRRNVNVRRKIWNEIATRLNRLSANGAEKDADGWKRCFKTWSLGVGPDYKSKMHELIQKVPSDVNYLIKVSDDEDEQSTAAAKKALPVYKNPIETQKRLLNDLVIAHKALLLSTADDEPLKSRLWQNIAEQLNNITGALILTSEQWKERVDLEKYRSKRGRKKTKPAKDSVNESNGTNTSQASINETAQASTRSKASKKVNGHQNNNSSINSQTINNVDSQLEELNETEHKNSDEKDANSTESVSSVPDGDDQALTYEPERKRPKSTPLVKNFKFTTRMMNAVEQLKDDVQCVNNTLKETTDSLISIRNVLVRQCEQQDELNALLKRSTQLLKVLVEFKIGKRTSAAKSNFHFNNNGEGSVTSREHENH